ncbi:MAG: NUDIX domain-containing protein [Chloroflexota bacterium]|nr:NUDIX domain-containing protein [Chloroflexota bacterium]
MHGALTELIEAIHPVDALEQAHIVYTLAWLKSGAPLCRIEKPATPPQHLVSYFVVIDPSQQKLLLVDHKQACLWLPSGGHVEPNEHPQATVRREAKEELGLDASFLWPEPLFLTVTQTVGRTAGHTDVSFWYALCGNCGDPLFYDREEFHAIAWFSLDRLPLFRTDPHLTRFMTKLMPRLT